MTAGSTRGFVDILATRAARQPHQTAYTFLHDGERAGDCLTWAALDERSRAIAAALRAAVPPGGRVLLLFPPGASFVPAFFGSLRARAIAVPAYPPSGSRADRFIDRLRRMAADAALSAVLAPGSVHARRAALVALIPELAGLPWLNTDALTVDAGSCGDGPAEPSDVALLQYTSGSTSKPRGVMVTHGNLLHNLAASAELAGHGPDSVGVSWLPVNHDMGLIDGILQPAFSGFPMCLMAPASFLQRPLRWLQAIARLRATHSGGPDFAYELCVRRTTESDRASLDLSTWRTAFNGSEPIRAATLEGFQRAFGECGFRWEAFRPAYGLAEATLLVTSSGADDEPHIFHADADALRSGSVEPATPGRQAAALVSSGRTAAGTAIAIVDPLGHRRCTPGQIGEIWVRGDSVAGGYWNSDAETAATFAARIADSGEGPFLRTGDLGFLRGGRLFVTGRIKDVVIVRGVKHYPQDIEATVERAYQAVKPHCTAAFNVDTGGRHGVAIVAGLETRPAREGWSPAEMTSMCAGIAHAVSIAHGLAPSAIALIDPGALPRTTSGKIERYRCRELLLSGGLAVVHLWQSHQVDDDLDSQRQRCAS